MKEPKFSSGVERCREKVRNNALWIEAVTPVSEEVNPFALQ